MARPHREVDYQKIEQYAAIGLKRRDMARCLGINVDTLYDWIKTNPLVQEALDRGLNTLIQNCATVIVASALKKRDAKEARAIMRTHGDGWDEKTIVEHQGSMAVEHKKIEVPLDAQIRCAVAFLRVNGYLVQAPEDIQA